MFGNPGLRLELAKIGSRVSGRVLSGLERWAVRPTLAISVKSVYFCGPDRMAALGQSEWRLPYGSTGLEMRVMFALAVLLGVCTEAVAEAPQSYALEAGDKIWVSVWQDPTLNRDIVVAPDGMISFPLVGQIRAAGMTIPALEKELSKRLRKNYQTEPQVTVTLSEVKEGAGSQVFITGEVNRPGPYAIQPGTSVMQAIALSGGLGKFAAKSRIQIHRKVAGSEQVLLFNYSDFESGKNLEGDIPLQAGDVIVVPERGLFN